MAISAVQGSQVAETTALSRAQLASRGRDILHLYSAFCMENNQMIYIHRCLDQ